MLNHQQPPWMQKHQAWERLRAILDTASGKLSGITWGRLIAPTCIPTVLVLSTSTQDE